MIFIFKTSTARAAGCFSNASSRGIKSDRRADVGTNTCWTKPRVVMRDTGKGQAGKMPARVAVVTQKHGIVR